LDMLPRYFGQFMIRAEATIYFQLSQLSVDYQGGYWEFYQLSNGGFYMAPSDPERLRLYVAGNDFDGELSADAAGIVACLFGFNRLCWETRDKHFVELEDYLKDYAKTHPEAEFIFRAID
jgi:hypothetical protein